MSFFLSEGFKRKTGFPSQVTYPEYSKQYSQQKLGKAPLDFPKSPSHCDPVHSSKIQTLRFTHTLWLLSLYFAQDHLSLSECLSPSLSPVATHPPPACVCLKVFMCVFACVCQSEWPLLSTAPSLLGIPLPLTPPSLSPSSKLQGAGSSSSPLSFFLSFIFSPSLSSLLLKIKLLKLCPCTVWAGDTFCVCASAARSAGS